MTTKMLMEIKRLHAEGLTDGGIAEKIGYSRETAKKWRKYLGLPINSKPGGKPYKIYFVWRQKDDELMAFGTARECAKMMGIKLGSFYSEVSRTGKGERKYYKISVERMEAGEYVS